MYSRISVPSHLGATRLAMPGTQTEVLIVGAGPVGLMTALLLAEAGIQVQIIDSETRTAARSYACALHPGTLRLLDRLGLTARLLDQGRTVQTVAFYEGETRRSELKLSAIGGKFPLMLVLPQAVLERALEERLRDGARVAVEWRHRFDDVREEGDTLSVNVEKLGGTSQGYIVPHWETVVQKQISINTRFLIGADGHNSLVRRRLGIDYKQLAGPQFFAAYEFEGESSSSDEVRIALTEGTTNILWPLPGNRRRWTFQFLKSDLPEDFPGKERRAVHLEEQAVDESIRQYVQEVAARRAPWFHGTIKEINWCTHVAFEHRLAQRFGRNRCWLAGDAAHQTGPAAAQSMNAGMEEASALASHLESVLRQGAALQSLESYDEERQTEWRRLLGLNGGFRLGDSATPWVRQHSPDLVSCIPGSGEDLARLAAQLGLEFHDTAAADAR